MRIEWVCMPGKSFGRCRLRAVRRRCAGLGSSASRFGHGPRYNRAFRRGPGLIEDRWPTDLASIAR